MKIVLSTAPENWMNMGRYLPSLGLLYIAGSMEAAGHKVEIVDAYINNYDVEKTAQVITSKHPDIIGVTATSHNRFKAMALMNRLKELNPGVPIFTGGKHFGRVPEDTLINVPSVDFVFISESELPPAEVATAIEKGEDYSVVRGLAFRENGKVKFTSHPIPVRDINTLAPPAWHLLEMSKYETYLEGEEFLEGQKKTKAIGLISSRGCPNLCNFCQDASTVPFRLRKPELFVDEVEMIYNKYGIRGFDFWDDTFTLVRKHVYGICEEIKRRQLDVKFYVRARVDTVDREMLEEMKSAGCAIIGYGVESGSQKILDIMHKRITIPQVLDAVKITKESGMTCKTFWMHSLPGETLEDIRMTLDLMKKVYRMVAGNHEVPPHANFATIYPGTELEQIARNEGYLLPSDFSWNKYIEFPQPKLINYDATVPLYENRHLKISEILAFCYRYSISKPEMVKRGLRGLKRCRSPEDFKTLMNIGYGYFFPVKDSRTEDEERTEIKILQ